MGWFVAMDDHPTTGRAEGFARYRQVLERDWKTFFLAGLLTLVGFVPFGLGLLAAFLTQSVLVLLIGCAVGGLFAGPALYGLTDLMFRSLRDAPANWWLDYRRALRRNWRSTLLPGVVYCLYLGILAFMAMLFWWAPVEAPISPGTLALYAVSAVLGTMLWSVYWPQLVLFEQSLRVRLKNCLLFCIKYFWHTLFCAVGQLAYWLLMVLLLPWSVLILPFIGLWFVSYAASFALYDDLNAAFRIEEQILEQFPEQTPIYEE